MRRRKLRTEQNLLAKLARLMTPDMNRSTGFMVLEQLFFVKRLRLLALKVPASRLDYELAHLTAGESH